MSDLRQDTHQRAIWLAMLLAAVALGVFLRFDQVIDQVLIDDEWHAIFQLQTSRPADIFVSFGQDDHCIPLTLLYWWLADQIGLSEWLMRLPMLIAGALLLVMLPTYVWNRFGPRVAVLCALLLALSPQLILYTRTARPYALTLLLILIAQEAVQRYCSSPRSRWRPGLAYVLAAPLAVWLHLISAPMVAAPLLIAVFAAGRRPIGERWPALKPLVALALIAAAVAAPLILPPLIYGLISITGKVGIDRPGWSMLGEIWYSFLGTQSLPAIATVLALAAIGVPRLWRCSPAARSLLLGLVLTVALVLVSRPLMSYYPLVLGRYLLPALPLVLLATAVGSVTVVEVLEHSLPPILRSWPVLLLTVPALLLAATSTLWPQLQHPSSTLTGWQLDFDRHRGILEPPARDFPLSRYWSDLARSPAQSQRIAVAPWYFISYDWDAPRWEAVGRQLTIPGYLIGLCLPEREGEVAHDRRFRFRNVVYLADVDDIAARGIDRVAYQRIYRGGLPTYGPPPDCEDKLRARYGAPVFEDDTLVVFDTQARRP